MKRLLFFILVFALLTANGQNEARIWYFGNGQGLDFSTSPPTVLTNGAITSTYGCASACNSTGALLFYTDGMTVYDQTHAVMANGSGLFGNFGAQTCVIVKKPASNNLYYIFTVQGGGGGQGFCYSIVDMSLSSGNGSVTAKNVAIYSSACEEKISATKHCNQTDAWIIVHPANANEFKAVPLTSAGVGSVVTTTVTAASTATFAHTGPSPNGTLKFSHNGRKLADVFTVVTPTIPFNGGACTLGYFETYDFDNNNGTVSNYYWPFGFIAPLGNAFGYGTEWSPDGTKLYWTYHGGIVQMNHCTYPPNINGGIIEIGETFSTSTQYHASIQCGPDGKIYVTNPGANSIGVIHNPNNPGSACNYQPIAISLGTAVCGRGLPNYYTPYFEKPTTLVSGASISGPSCQTFSFNGTNSCPVIPNAQTPFSGYVVIGAQWNFGDPGSGSSNTSTLVAPTHSFSAPGSYTVQSFITYLCGRTDTVYTPVIVYGPPIVSVSSPTMGCGSTSATVSATGTLGATTHTWMPGNFQGSVLNNVGPGTYTVYTKDAGTSCVIQTTFNVANALVSSAVSHNTICAGVSNGSAAVLVQGSSTYSVSWTGSSSTSTIITGLGPGFYTVTVTDTPKNCTLTTAFQIVQSFPLTPSLVASPLVNCTGLATVLSATTGGGTYPHSFYWSNNNNQNSNVMVVTQSLPGNYTYTLLVSDATNCSTVQTIGISFLATPTVVTASQTLCAGKSITLSATGANTYTWYPMGTQSPSVVVTPPGSTVFSVTGKSQSCMAFATANVTVFPVPILQLVSNSPICEGQNLAFMATGAQIYSWSGPSSFTSQLTNPVISPAFPGASGQYTVIGVDSNSCSKTSSITVKVNPKPVLQLNANNSVCEGSSLNLGVSGAINYTWTGPVFYSTSQAPVINSVQPSAAGIYSITGVSSASCAVTATLLVTVNPLPTITISGTTSICAGETATLSVSGANNYTWNTSNTQSTILVTPLNSQIYSVVGQDVNGCSSQTQFTLTVSKCLGLYENTLNDGYSFSPNPCGELLYFETSVNVRIEILYLNSSVLLEKNFTPGKYPLDLSGMAEGIYLLKVYQAQHAPAGYRLIKTGN